jgi:peptide deformylase
LRRLHLVGASVLRSKAAPVDLENDSGILAELLEDMWRILREKEGLGLAAPQAGESLRLFILDIDDLCLRGHRVFVNPEIQLSGPLEKVEEGCLSVPGIYEPVQRSSRVIVKAMDAEGREFSLELEGLLARVIQHEFDHLEGVLFVDHLSPVRRRLLRSKISRLKEEEAAGIPGN